MKSHLLPWALAAMLVAGCASPADNAVVAPYRAPRDAHNVQYSGGVNHRQMAHLQRTVFPRLTPEERTLVRKVNREVNEDIVYLTDLDNYGIWDRQVTEPDVRKPAVFGMPRKRYGDCEDYALTKKHRLVKRGIDQTRLFCATALIRLQGQTWRHTVLAVPEGNDWWVLNNWDNIIDRASGLERTWGWHFIWPDFGSYRSARDPSGNLLTGNSGRMHGEKFASAGGWRYASSPARR
ncbi:MAG: hypothetical protein FGM15_08895 [Chthoniobacterales bacterium]|nr:hypothetical protein [Chthoniobacterales bacterium]